MPERCNKKYGKKLICRRLVGHAGHHAVRPTAGELRLILLGRMP